MGDEAGPAEREVASLRFQQLCRLKIFDEMPESLTPPERLHLLAVSNKYGFTFVGSDTGVKIFQTTELGRLDELNRDSTGAVVSDYDCVKITLGTRPLHVALNNSELILSVCYQQGKNLVLNLYDVRVVTKKGTSHSPFLTSFLSQDPQVKLVNLVWNPGFEPLLGTCLSDGNCMIWDSSDKALRPLACLPAEVGTTAICWSPKGKQMVVGTSNGELKQFNHASELKKIVKSPDFTQEAVKVVDIYWLSTYMYIVAYIDAEESLQPNIVIVHAPKERPVSYINFEDVCFGSCEERAACYYMQYLDKWQFAITCSSNSMDGAVLGRQQENKDLWEIWTLDDAARIEVPLCDHEETMPLGMATDYTSQINITIKQHTLPPAPILMVLSSEGLLCPFYVINLEDAEGNTRKPQPLPTGGERIGTGTAVQILPSAGAQPQPSIGQATTASLSFTSPAPAPSAAPPKIPSTASSAPAQPAFGAASAAAASGQPSMFGGFSGGAAAAAGSSAGFQFKLPASTASAAPASSGPQASSTMTTPMFGGSKSSPFGGFSFSAPQTSTPSSTAATTTQASGLKGFSFAAPSQSVQQQAPSTQGFSFKAASAPSGLSNAPSSNAFGAFHKPITTTATPAPSVQTTQSSAKPVQPEQPKGPPNATAPGGMGGFGQQGLFGRGPPNAVAPGFSAAPTQGQLGGAAPGPPNAVAPGTASHSLKLGSAPAAAPAAAPTAATPVIGSVSQGSASITTKFTVPKTAAAVGPSLSAPLTSIAAVAPTSIAAVAPSSVAAVAPTRSTPASFGPPNAVAPNQGPSSFNEAKPSKDVPDAHRVAVGKPVAIVQQTPKATADVISSSRIPATSTPAASAKPVTAALLSNIKEEMEHFTKELNELKARAATGHHSVGSTQDLQQICKGVDDLATFKEEVLECTKSHNEDIHGLKAKLLNSFSLVEESRLRKQRSKDPRYLQLLRSRGLDPQSAKQMQEIRSLYHYLETGVRDTNACLDLEWEKITHGKGSKSTRRMVTPTMDTIYQTLGNHVNILTTQKNKLIDLRKQLTTAQRYDVTSTFNALPSSKIKLSTNPSSLATRLAEVKVSGAPKARSTPMSAKKQAMLRDVLSQRQTTPIRSAPRAALVTSSRGGSPSEMDDFPLPPERRLRFPSGESPPYGGSQGDGRRPAHHAGRTDLRGVGVTTSATAPQTAPSQPLTTQTAPRPATTLSTPSPQQPMTRSTQPPAQPQRTVAPPLSTLNVPVSPIQPGAGMVTSTPLPQGAQGSSLTTPKGQAPTPATSSFSHTGSGTVSWGLTGATAKATSPGQQAGVAAISRAQSIKAGNTPVEKPNPPVVNIKNLDTMKGTMPPPVTFAPVASTVDAGTAKVVTQVIAEMAMASGVKLPQPGTVASASGHSLPQSPTGRKPTTPITTQATSSAIAMTTVSLSSKPVLSTNAAPSVSLSIPILLPTSQPAAGATAASGGSKPAGAKADNPSAFSLTAKLPSSTASGVASKGFTFGDKPVAAPSASGLSSAYTFGSKPITSSAAALPSAKGDAVNQPAVSTESGVKPQIFDFSGAATKPKANVSTPGGYFFGAPSSTVASFGAPATTIATISGTKTTSALATATSQSTTVKTSAPPPSAPKVKEDAKGKDESGTGKPTAATDEAGTGAATKPSTGFGSSSLLGDMLDKPPSGGSLLGAMLDKPAASKQQTSTAEDENAKLQQSTKSILSGVTFPTGTSAGASQSGTASPGPAARNLFGTTPSTSAVSGLATTTPSFGTSGLFSSLANTSKGLEAATATTAPAPQTASSAPGSLFGKTTSPESLFGAQPTSSTTSAGSTATTTAPSTGFGVFGQPTGAVSTKPSLFGQTSTAATSSAQTTSAPSFGQSPGLFGQTSSGGPFGSAAGGSGGFTFGGQPTLGSASQDPKSVFGASQPAASTATPVFGGSQTSNLSFGQLAGSGSTATSSASGGGGMFGATKAASSTGGGFFSGLGGKPDPEAAKRNPFGLETTSSGFGSQSSDTSIFGSSTSKTFGASQTAPAFGSPSSSAFGTSSGVANTGFGGFGQPAFGQTNTASPGFGSPGVGAGAGAGGLGFGTGATFSNPLGGSPFGSPQQGSSPGVFGPSSPAASTGGGFGTFASQAAPSFGALAGSGGGFGQQQQQQQQQSSGFGAFGAGGANNTGFGAFGSGSNNAFDGANTGSPG
ncbi:nuclear pore complex protein Nup214-like [Lytechinus pictus]|uniref:nuclear pore complex protein Nup214-like n=1 Tax=Lytechinus pictus TaxID=7653 RepID=UPI0030B9C1C6